MGSSVEKSLALDSLDSPRPVVLIEHRLDPAYDLRVVLDERLRPPRARRFFTGPMASQNRPAGIRIGVGEDAHGFEDGDRARRVVGGARRAMPGIEVSRQHYVLLGQLHTLQLGDHVELRDLTRPGDLGIDTKSRLLIVHRQSIQESVVLAGQHDVGSIRATSVLDHIRSVNAEPPGFDHAQSARVHESIDETPPPVVSDVQVATEVFDPAGEPGFVRCPLLAQALDGLRACVGLQLIRAATSRISRTQQYPFPPHKRKPLGRVGTRWSDGWQSDDIALHGPIRAGAVRQEPGVEGLAPGRDEVYMQGPVVPSHPGAVGLAPGAHPPPFVGLE